MRCLEVFWEVKARMSLIRTIKMMWVSQAPWCQRWSCRQSWPQLLARYVGSDNNSTYKRYNPSYGFIKPFKGIITPFTGYLYSRGPSCTRLILPYHPSLPDLLTGCKYNELPATRIMIQKDIQQSKAFSNGTSCGSPKGQKTPSKRGTVFLWKNGKTCKQVGCVRCGPGIFR